MTAGEWLLVRQSLYSFVQGRKIKVSLFLQNSMQNLDGSFMLSCKTGPMPLGSEKPGKIRCGAPFPTEPGALLTSAWGIRV